MAYKPIIRELLRSIESTIHERFAMIEDVIRLEVEKEPPMQNDGSEDMLALNHKISSLAETLDHIVSRIAALESKGPSETVHVTRVGTELHAPVALQSIFTQSMAGLDIYQKNEVLQVNQSTIDYVGEDEEEVAEEEAEEEVAEEEAEEEEEEQQEEEEEEEEEEAMGEEEEEGIELEEFPYKGKLYYKDSENKIYTLNADGEPIVVGRLDTATNRVLRVTAV